MSRVLGILVIVVALYGLILASDARARTVQNHQRIAERLALYGLLTLGAGVLIISGGIDLSIGSVFALAAIGLGLLLSKRVPVGLAVSAVVVGAVLIGLLHGLLVTRLRLQPFIVTLCGLFIYRGLAMWLALPDPLAPVRGLLRVVSGGLLYADATSQTGSAGNVGIGGRSQELADLIYLSAGYPDLPGLSLIPVRLLLLMVVAALVAVLLHLSVYGRYLYAVGANEQAARYAGIATARYKVLAYVLCSVLAAVGGMVELLDLQTASPSSTGTWLELYAITGAVLGGCSLRGGEGTVLGMLLGTAVLPLLRNLINFSAIPPDLEYTVIGVALLLGTIADELLKRRAARRG
jgi:ribose transport system permease protein